MRPATASVAIGMATLPQRVPKLLLFRPRERSLTEAHPLPLLLLLLRLCPRQRLPRISPRGMIR